MTAEIAIMNMQGVALAADSAVTQGQKVFPSANKIFTLSKYHPVGIMCYGNASFMEVPWETLIKAYRRRIGKLSFPTIEEYAAEFIGFLRESKGIWPAKQQERYFAAKVYGYFYTIREEIDREIGGVITKTGRASEDDVRTITEEAVRRHHALWKKAPAVPGVSRKKVRTVVMRHKATIAKAKAKVFEKLPINNALSRLLSETTVNLFGRFEKNYRHASASGVVIAGFGDGQLFPSLRAYLLEGMVDDLLKYIPHESVDVAFDNSAAIVPFAQSEMVFSFMEGIEPAYDETIATSLRDVFTKFPEAVVDAIDCLSDNERASFKRRLRGIGKAVVDKYITQLEQHRRKHYVTPVIDVVAMLPKDELAAMAEAMVNLTSFKRRVSMQAETVGGPIDVAVISKGDGFVWVRRKHYFERELNFHFFANYFRETGNEQDD